MALLVGLASWMAGHRMTRWSIRFARHYGIVAHVTSRSSHHKPTAQAGGIGLFGGIVAAFAVLFAFVWLGDLLPAAFRPGPLLTAGWPDPPPWIPLAGAFVAVAMAFLLGLADDLWKPPALWRLAAQIVIALTAAAMGMRLSFLHLPGLAEPIPLGNTTSVLLTVVWILLVTNAVNFMDGINGLAGRFGQIVALFTIVSVWGLEGSAVVIVVAVALLCSTQGFLVFNIRRTHTFLGDCGSQPLGVFVALLGILTLSLPALPPLPLPGYVLIVSPFLFDVIFTLYRRARRGANLLVAHREHLYQRHLLATGMNHDHTRRFVARYLVLCGASGAVYLRFFRDPGHWPMQAGLLLLGGMILAHYARQVWRAEQHQEVPG